MSGLEVDDIAVNDMRCGNGGQPSGLWETAKN